MEKGILVEDLVLIGGSAGSLDVLLQILPALRPDVQAAIILVLHRKATSETVLTQLLKQRTNLPVRDVEEKDRIWPGVIYVSPGDYHLLFESDGTLSLDDSERILYSRPSIDVSFESAAMVYGSRLTCILLSGANADGSEGMLFARKEGAYTIAQTPDSAELPLMPKAAIDNGAAMIEMQPSEILSFLNSRKHL
ncbi:chemotaxis protein CheB [Rurimicrobium arvi]|uniref:protein-glutamate methylesterase n=1 Tax=Rurimicrobium arvi TaxID=2049916 RepID=A0ABP8MGE9_9BACT